MSALPPDPSSAPGPSAPRAALRGWLGFLGQVILLLACGAGAVALAAATEGIDSPLGILLLTVALLLPGVVIYEHLRWRRPITRLVRLLDEMNRGEAPLDELRKLSGGLTPLRDPLRDLLHQVRSARTRVAELNCEIQQRVLTRTESLERKLGSLQVQASRDVLTGLMNRRAMELDLPRLVRDCRSTGQPLQLMLVDVDHFKVLNDTLGHLAGDDLLRSIGQLMRSSLRNVDHAFRYGGDEFVILLSGVDPAAAQALADRLGQLVEGLTRQHRQLPLRPRLSIGIAGLAEIRDTDGPERLLALADERLYQVKHARPKPAQRVA